MVKFNMMSKIKYKQNCLVFIKLNIKCKQNCGSTYEIGNEIQAKLW